MVSSIEEPSKGMGNPTALASTRGSGICSARERR
jgi:hypothetical protein